MKIHDISIAFRPSMAVWPGDDPFQAAQVQSIAKGDHCNVSRLQMGSHNGTHVDAPLHFIDGAGSVDAIDLHSLAGPAEVLDCTGMKQIDASALRGRLRPGVIPLLKTDSSFMPDAAPFRQDYVYVTTDAAELLAASRVPSVGIDYLSIAGAGEAGAATHRTLLGAGLAVIEGLRLAHVQPGRYMLACLPLKIEGCDGAPARAILIEE